MKHFWIIVALLVSALLEQAQAGSLITNPVVMVTPMVLDFGSVKSKTSVTNSVLVENAGGGKLVGKATVSGPFKIVSGGNYTLKTDSAQLVTIAFTGGGGAKVTLTGRLAGGRTGKQ